MMMNKTRSLPSKCLWANEKDPRLSNQEFVLSLVQEKDKRRLHHDHTLLCRARGGQDKKTHKE